MTNGYRRAFAKHGESPKSLQWISYKSAAVRYREIVRDLKIDEKSILDAGCGMGDLLPYLHVKTDNFFYLGVDINDDFIEIAKKRYAGHNFEVVNPFGKNFNRQFDIVLSSGVMNFNGARSLDRKKKMITKLFSLTREVLAFNMAGYLIRPPREVQRIAYVSAEGIFNHCKNLTSKVVLRTDYRPGDFTVTLRR